MPLTGSERNLRKKVTNLMGGAQEAIMTFFAPASRAIWMISFEVVPRTIESAVVQEHEHSK